MAEDFLCCTGLIPPDRCESACLSQPVVRLERPTSAGSSWWRRENADGIRLSFAIPAQTASCQRVKGQSNVHELHLYFHSGTTDTKYTGTIQVGFLPSPHEVKVNMTVNGGDPAGNSSVSGILSSKPGRYAMTVAIDAENGGTRQIRESVPVTVK